MFVFVKLIFEFFNLQEVPVAHQISDGKLEIGDKVELKGEPLEHAERYYLSNLIVIKHVLISNCCCTQVYGNFCR